MWTWEVTRAVDLFCLRLLLCAVFWCLVVWFKLRRNGQHELGRTGLWPSRVTATVCGSRSGGDCKLTLELKAQEDEGRNVRRQGLITYVVMWCKSWRQERAQQLAAFPASKPNLEPRLAACPDSAVGRACRKCARQEEMARPQRPLRECKL